MEQERRARKAREARHKLECDRLRRQIGDLQARRHVSRVQMLGCVCGFRGLGYLAQPSLLAAWCGCACASHQCVSCGARQGLGV